MFQSQSQRSSEIDFGLPDGCPDIPYGTPTDTLVAIVAIHHPDGHQENCQTQFRKRRMYELEAYIKNKKRQNIQGSYVYLHQIDGQSVYVFGRAKAKISTKANADEKLDVYIPGGKVAKKQFALVPIYECDGWRIEATSETMTEVNGVPLRALTNRTKKMKDTFPQVLQLNLSTTNTVQTPGAKIELWMLKSAREFLGSSSKFVPVPVHNELQDVDSRSEEWAQNPYILHLDAGHVTERSYRVIQRFTGKRETAKLFLNDGARRDAEFLLFNREKVDRSIVQYLRMTEIIDIPAIITSTHEGFLSYANLQDAIVSLHPGMRFEYATKMLRRLFRALEFLHFHGVVHGQVTKESVLLCIVDNQIHDLLLVDYTNAWPVPPSEGLPSDHMIADARRAMELIEHCCDIWTLRKAAPHGVLDEDWSRIMTEKAADEYNIARRAVSFYFENKGEDKDSEKGIKLRKLLAKKDMDWAHAKANQIHNATRREIGSVTEEKLKPLIESWSNATLPQGINEMPPMILSLGHAWLDGLANALVHKKWDLTPREICAKLKTLEGSVEEPWRTLPVSRSVTFELVIAKKAKEVHRHFEENSFIQYLATCCELYPGWWHTILVEFERCVHPANGSITRDDIESFLEVLSSHGPMPPNMEKTLRILTTLEVADWSDQYAVKEVHRVWYHMPSKMFNITQLQRLVHPFDLKNCIESGTLRCNNFAEVRGDPKIQGCYVPLSLLAEFAGALRLDVDVPNIDTPFPTLDPSDFSQVRHEGRIILARPGLVAYASVIRDGNQFSWHSGQRISDFESGGTFVPTYFGDMKVLPRLPNDESKHPYPCHWSKFKTVEEVEASLNTQDRRKLSLVSIKAKLNRAHRQTANVLSRSSKSSSPPASLISLLERTLQERVEIRAQISTPRKRAMDLTLSASDAVTLSPKRVRTVPSSPLFSPKHAITQSFIGRNENLYLSPPRKPMDEEQVFMKVKEDKKLKEELKLVDQWIEDLSDSEDSNEEKRPRFTNFVFHDLENESESSSSGFIVQNTKRTGNTGTASFEEHWNSTEGNATSLLGSFPRGRASSLYREMSPIPTQHTLPGQSIPQWIQEMSEQRAEYVGSMPDTEAGDFPDMMEDVQSEAQA